MPSHPQLSVNINKIATLRNARGGTIPNVVEAAERIQSFGAHGITVHPRPDQRHIRYADVEALRPVVKDFNVEGYPDAAFLELVLRVRPNQVTLVPDPPHVLTSQAGWDTVEHQSFLQDVLGPLKAAGIRTSLFVVCNEEHLEGAREAGADRIELYTEDYARGFEKDPENAVAPYVYCAEVAHRLGLGVNAGHDLNSQNLAYFAQNVPHLDEVSIGHALIADALYWGLENTVQIYARALRS